MKVLNEYEWLQMHGFKLLAPWHLLEQKDMEKIRGEYLPKTDFDFMPFAKRQDNDDVAGFKVVNGEVNKEVITVNLTLLSKHEPKGITETIVSSDLTSWMKEVMLADTDEWINEEELDDILKTKDLF